MTDALLAAILFAALIFNLFVANEILKSITARLKYLETHNQIIRDRLTALEHFVDKGD